MSILPKMAEAVETIAYIGNVFDHDLWIDEPWGDSLRIWDERGIDMAVRQQIDIEITDCCVCGGHIAFSHAQYRDLLENHRVYYCPMGHGQSFIGITEAERLRTDLTNSQDRVTRLESENRNLAAIVDAANKKTRRAINRADKGVCQHCHRHFVNVERHVATKHGVLAP